MSSAGERAAAVAARLGKVLAAGIVEEVARLMSEAPPGGVWGRTLEVPGTLRAEWWPATKAAVEELLFAHPSWKVTGGSASWGDPAGRIEAAAGHVAYLVVCTWPRVEDSPLARELLEGRGSGAPTGLLGGPGPIPALELPSGVLRLDDFRRGRS